MTPGTTLVGYSRPIVPAIPVKFNSRYDTRNIPLQNYIHLTSYLLRSCLARGYYGKKTDKNKDSVYPLLLHIYEFKRVESIFLSEKTQR